MRGHVADAFAIVCHRHAVYPPRDAPPIGDTPVGSLLAAANERAPPVFETVLKIAGWAGPQRTGSKRAGNPGKAAGPKKK